MAKPQPSEYPAYFATYINQVAEEDLPEAFRNQLKQLQQFLHSVDEAKADHAYAVGKWTLKELLQHVIDGERIFTYRALSFARKETTSLPSFDENIYAQNSNSNSRSWKSLSNELINVRRSTEDLYNSFTEDMLQQKGNANNNTISVLSLGFTIIGHVTHHIKIAEQRYLAD